MPPEASARIPDSRRLRGANDTGRSVMHRSTHSGATVYCENPGKQARLGRSWPAGFPYTC